MFIYLGYFTSNPGQCVSLYDPRHRFYFSHGPTTTYFDPVPRNRMPAKKSDFQVLETVGTGTFGICKLIKRISDGKVRDCPLLAKQFSRHSNTEHGKKRISVTSTTYPTPPRGRGGAVPWQWE